MSSFRVREMVTNFDKALPQMITGLAVITVSEHVFNQIFRLLVFVFVIVAVPHSRLVDAFPGFAAGVGGVSLGMPLDWLTARNLPATRGIFFSRS
jgi:hypothetical protein